MLDVSIEILKKIDNAITHEVLEEIEERGKICCYGCTGSCISTCVGGCLGSCVGTCADGCTASCLVQLDINEWLDREKRACEATDKKAFEKNN